MNKREPAFALRLGDLKPLVEEAAKRNRRSLNAEILVRLERSFNDEKENAPGSGSKHSEGVDGITRHEHST